MNPAELLEATDTAVKIDKDNLRQKLPAREDCLLHSGGCPYDVDVLLLSEHQPDPREEKWPIVNDENPDRRLHAALYLLHAS